MTEYFCISPRILKDMTFYTEAGLAYFNEDFRAADDKSSLRARVSMKWNWPLFDDRITLYHYNEIFPPLSRIHRTSSSRWITA